MAAKTQQQRRQRNMRKRRTLNQVQLVFYVAAVIVTFSLFNIYVTLVVQSSKSTDDNQNTDDNYITPTVDPSNEQLNKTRTSYYRLAKNTDYHYEFRYELRTNDRNDDHRLMILFNGRGRTCTDYWKFSVGRRIIYSLREFNFSILAICSKRRAFDIYSSIPVNEELNWIYTLLQIWINTVYYKRFQHYPRLYLHGISLGSAFATLVSRVLPVQAQILSCNVGGIHSLTTPSKYSVEMQTRLILDPTFASWFYFDFCYNATNKTAHEWRLCPFQSKIQNYYPVPPTYYVALRHDRAVPVKKYHAAMKKIQSNLFNLGGTLLSHSRSIILDIIQPTGITATTMQETLDIWSNKSHASRIFLEYIEKFSFISRTYKKRGTCKCSRINFTYWEGSRDIIQTWTKQMQIEHDDYIRDVKKYRGTFCEDMCGDILAYHGMVSRNIQRPLRWFTEIDQRRHTMLIKDYLTRPLRIWMYDKESLTNDTEKSPSCNTDWTSVPKQYEMYSAECHFQNYLNQLKTSNKRSHHNLTWSTDPLLADYYSIPSDLMFFYFHCRPESLNSTQYKDLRDNLNKVYFEKLLTNVHTRFPYWTMTPTINQTGSNHIIVFPGRRNMGFLYEKNQKLLQNVIQLSFAGIIPDLLPSTLNSSTAFDNISITNRHGYDIVIPQFTPLRWNLSDLLTRNEPLHKKTYLFYFPETLNHLTIHESTPIQLDPLLQNMREDKRHNQKIKIQGKLYETSKTGNNSLKTEEYIKSIESSVFSICSESYRFWLIHLYHSVQLGTIPVILADNAVPPFEKFIDWRSFTVKVNATNMSNLIGLVRKIDGFETYVKRKLDNAIVYFDAFRWPYTIVKQGGHHQYAFVPEEGLNEGNKNVFHYLVQELRCRRLEQLYGLTADGLSEQSVKARQHTCKNHPTVCPCKKKEQYLAIQEYV